MGKGAAKLRWLWTGVLVAAAVAGLALSARPAGLEVDGVFRLEIMMDTDARRLFAGETGRAAVSWHQIASHPSLPYDRARIALAALLYGKILFAHEETRVELFRRIERAALGLINGEERFHVEDWKLQAGGMSFPIWPWRIVHPAELKTPKTYVATLLRTSAGNFWIHLDMEWGLEAALAPSSPLISLFTLSKELDTRDRMLLGAVLVAMNKYYRTPDRAAKLGSEMDT